MTSGNPPSGSRQVSRWEKTFSVVGLSRAGITAALVFTCSLHAAEPALMPLPASLHSASGKLPIDAHLSVAFTGAADARVPAATTWLLRNWSERTGLVLSSAPVADSAHATLVIAVQTPSPVIPTLDDAESYTLTVSVNKIRVTAPTTTGALRGLATLVQLLQADADGFFLPAVSIEDRPRFRWRGLLIDVARHWQPIDVIERTLDGMALVKLNVLHLHLTDDQGFRVESKKFPELTQRGSDGHSYTHEDIRALVAYAAARGIRVVPEFDIPGHATSWVVSHPELASLPGPYAIERHWGVFDPVLDPTNEALYTLLGDFLGEMADLFPDAYLHIGGDENNGKQWNANPRIQKFIHDHDLGNNEGLHAYFNRRISAILAQHGKRLIGWDEIFHPDLPKDAVIHSWRGAASLAEAARRGYAGILSSGYYIDLNHSAADHYRNDPIPAGSTLTAEEQSRILGGEATMWSEWVTPENIDSRIWPRTAAIAERLWSPATVSDVDDMYRRLNFIATRLEETGSLHEKNYVAMLRRFAGDAATDPTQFAQLCVFADLLEPVKDYRREEFMPDANSATPLTGLADCVRPDSRTARDFSATVNQLIFASDLSTASKAARAVSDYLRAWTSAANTLLNDSSHASPRLHEAVPLARQLADAAHIGDEALALWTHEQSPPSDWMQTNLASLDHDATGCVAAELAVLPPLRRLVCAAAEQTSRNTSDLAAWQARIEHLAAEPVDSEKR